MRIGILTCALNFDETIEDNRPVRNLCASLAARGHEIVHLDTDEAKWDGDELIYPALAKGEQLDLFIGFYPGEAPIPYEEQLRHLDSRFPSPVPYEGQRKAADKTALISTFEGAALPAPRSFDGNDMEARETVLKDIAARGAAIVMKPDFGGSGYGIIRVNTVEDAKAAFDDFDTRGERFMMQDYVDTGGADYRAYVVGDQVIAGIVRTAGPGQWKTNVALGSTVGPHVFTEAQKADAVAAMKASNLGFGGVDILIDRQTGRHYISEVNDACSGTESIDNAHPGMRVSEHVANYIDRTFGRK